jgi:hypothetical protein
MAALSPLGFAVNAYGTFTGKTPAEKQTGSLPGKRRPLGGFVYGTLEGGIDQAQLTGAFAFAAAGAVNTNFPNEVRALSPFLFATPERVILPKGENDIAVSITGAAIFGQGEELEGANVTIRIDGASAFALTNLEQGQEEPVQEVYTAGFDNLFDSATQRKKREEEELIKLMKQLYDMSPDP